MITANVIHRVFLIRFGGSQGTAFTIDINNKQYLVTAKHVVEPLRDNDRIDIFRGGDWSSLEARLVGHSKDADVSVLAVPERLTPPNLAMEPTAKGLAYGQDTYFLGFPYGYLGSFLFRDAGYPLPFVKKATVSLLDRKQFILDGHNNPGFSGAPVVFTEPNKNVYKVAAIVSGYRYVDEPIYAGPGKSGLTYQYNTGLIVTHDIQWARDLIDTSPIGLELT